MTNKTALKISDRLTWHRHKPIVRRRYPIKKKEEYYKAITENPAVMMDYPIKKYPTPPRTIGKPGN